MGTVKDPRNLFLAASVVTDEPDTKRVSGPKRRRGFSRVPTHSVETTNERRLYPRAVLSLPLRVRRVAGVVQSAVPMLLTANISSSGVFFLCPQKIEIGTPVEIEIQLVERPAGRGSVLMETSAHIVRMEDSGRPGWHALAATFDDITFVRDEALPGRFLAK